MSKRAFFFFAFLKFDKKKVLRVNHAARDQIKMRGVCNHDQRGGGGGDALVATTTTRD